MKLGEQIQKNRKRKGLSQEELAEKIGVSRQAVSKWESDQSVPDWEKMLALSTLFGVSVDAILKGESEQEWQQQKKIHAGVFVAVATAFNSIGVIAAYVIWREWQTLWALGTGLILMVVGCMIFGIGQILSMPGTKERMRYRFWQLNIWLLLPLPLTVVWHGTLDCLHYWIVPVEPFYTLFLRFGGIGVYGI